MQTNVQKMSLPRALLLVAAAAFGPAAYAASVTLVPSSSTVVQNNAFTIDLMLNAVDVPSGNPRLFGGKVVIDFNPALISYTNSIVLAPGVSYFSNPAVGTSGGKQTLTFGFDNATENGKVATISFNAVGTPPSIAQIGLRDFSQAIGTFQSYYPGYQPFIPTFTGTSVTLAPVPAPAALWLLGSGLGLLAARRQLMARFSN